MVACAVLLISYRLVVIGPVPPSATVEVAQSPTPTQPAPTSAAASVDCGPITDRSSCEAAVKTTLRLSGRDKDVASVVIQPRASAPACPSRTACIGPTQVKLVDVAGVEIATILLAEYPNGVWAGYPVAQGGSLRVIAPR
jgi:hypothetical protein